MDDVGHVDLSGVGYALPDGRVLLDDVSFRVGEGAVVALVGPNGAGKTTLLRLVAGDLTPSPPLRVTTPACGVSSPVMIRSSVVLPAPLAPTSATLAPSPTRNDTSSSSTRPSGRVCRTPETST